MPILSPRNGTYRDRRALVAAAVGTLVVAASAVTSGPTVNAGSISPYNVSLFINVVGPDAGTVLDGLTVEFWANRALEPELCSNSPESFGGFLPVIAGWVGGCLDVPAGTYNVGLDGVPPGFTVDATCTSATPQSVGPNEVIPGTESFEVLDLYVASASCQISVVQPVVLIDKIVDGGTAGTDDFTIEVYPAAGGSVVGTGVDPSPASCLESLAPTSISEPVVADCAVIGLPAGDYQLGELPVTGYAPTNVGCISLFGGDREAFPDDVGTFSLGDDTSNGEIVVAYCEVTNTYSEAYTKGSVSVTKQVINDNGGTATADDFTAEVYLDGGALATSGACAADGDCIEAELPIGDYRIGEAGPDGYTATVACSASTGSVPEIGTVPPTTVPILEAIAGAGAAFTLTPEGSVTCVITNDDIAPTTGILPPTGSGNRTSTVVALGLLALGGTLVVLRRRTA